MQEVRCELLVCTEAGRSSLRLCVQAGSSQNSVVSSSGATVALLHPSAVLLHSPAPLRTLPLCTCSDVTLYSRPSQRCLQGEQRDPRDPETTARGTVRGATVGSAGAEQETVAEQGAAGYYRDAGMADQGLRLS